MLTVNKLIPQARGLAGVLLRRATTVELDWDTRQRSRFDATDAAGRAIAVFLPRGTAVRGGDVLVVEDGSLVAVKAALQPVLVVRPCSEHGSPFDLTRAAYHLGNRHVALELQPDHLKLEPDHVLAGLLRSMHLIVTEEVGAFEPESGAYAAVAGHGHDKGRGHDHGDGHDHSPGQGHEHDQHHDQGHDDSHDANHRHAHVSAAAPATTVADTAIPPRGKPLRVPLTAAAPAHVHGPGCGHGHGAHARHPHEAHLATGPAAAADDDPGR